MAKKSLHRYLAKIKKDYNVVLTEENYKDIILEELESPPSLLDYFRDYMEKNKAKITLEWGCLMFLFIKADEEKYAPDIEKYYRLLETYTPNWFTEVGLAELQLRYYGNVSISESLYFLLCIIMALHNACIMHKHEDQEDISKRISVKNQNMDKRFFSSCTTILLL